MTDRQHPPDKENSSLEKLGSRIIKARHTAGLDNLAAETEGTVGSGLGAAWRISIEIVVALVVCTGIGWVLDYWFDTKPWLMLLFLFLGGGAGVNNAVRTALRMDADLVNEMKMKPKTNLDVTLEENKGDRGDG